MKRWLVWGVVLSLAIMPLTGRATERGLASYPDGAENFFCGALPPPGIYFQNYFLYYNAPRIRGNVPPDSHGEVIANVFRFVYISKFKILGADWGAQVVVPLLYSGLHLAPLPVSDYQVGFGNISINPLLLGWHFREYHVTFGFDIDFPGSYSPTKPASPAQGYFTFRPVLGLGWLPKWGLGANVKLMYDFPTKNTNPIETLRSRDYYQSGQAIHFDYCLDYAVLPNLRLGAAGFAYWQTTADNQDGRKIGNHARQFAIGPAVKFDYQKWSFCLIYQWELATLNRPEGQRLWFRTWYAF